MSRKYIGGTYTSGYTLSGDYGTITFGVEAFVKAAYAQNGGQAVLSNSSATIDSEGTILASNENSVGIHMLDGGDVTNGSSTNSRSLIQASKYGVGIEIANAIGTITNFAQIYTEGAGVGLEAGGTVQNFGTIQTGSQYALEAVFLRGTGTIINGSATHTDALVEGNRAVEVYSANDKIMNYGTIIGLKPVPNGLTSHGVYLYGGNGVSLTNGGTADSTALISGDTGIYAHYYASVTNFGTVSGSQPGDESIAFGIDFRAGGGRVVNGSTSDHKALIEGDAAGVYALHGVATVTNFGTITADYRFGIELRDGGSVTNGAASDTYALVQGEFDGIVSGQPATITNFGTITGEGATSGSPGGVILDGGSVTNGSASDTIALIYGINFGIMTEFQSTIVNYGKIESGSEAGGFGVHLQAASGPISLRNGSNSDTHALIDSTMGIGLSVGSVATITNFGTITGNLYYGIELEDGGLVTNGSASDHAALIDGPTGIFLGGTGTLVNFGTVQSVAGTSVELSSSGNMLVIEAGSKLVGSATGAGGTLEFGAGGGAGTVSGLGTGTLAGAAPGTFTGFGTYLIGGAASWELTGSNTIGSSQVLGVGGGATLTNAGTVSAAGQITIGDSSALAGRLITDVGATLNLTADYGIGRGLAGGSLFTNMGILAKIGGSGTSVVAVNLVDTGTISVATGTLEFTGKSDSFAGSISGAGTITFGGGADTLSSGAHLTALSNLALSGSTTQLSVATNLNYGGALVTSGGTLSVGSGDVFTSTGTNILASTIGGAGTLVIGGGATTLNLGSHLTTLSNLKLAGGTLTVNTPLGFAGALTSSGGTLNVASGNVLTLTGTDTLASTISGAGTLAIGGGTTSLNLGSHLTTLSNLKLSSGTLTANTSLGFAGTLAGSGGTLSVTSGNVFTLTGTDTLASTIGGAGTLAITGGTTMLSVGSHLTALSNLALTGSTTKLGIATSLSYAGSLVSSGGTLSIGSGDTFTLSGTDTIASAIVGTGTLAVGGGTTTLNIGSHLTGLAALNLSSHGTLTVTTPLGFAGVLTEAAGTTLALGSSKFTLTGASSTLNGAVTGTGTLGLGSGVSLHLGGTVSSTETVALTGTDRLLLGSPSGFGATIAGLDSTDGLDFTGFALGSTSLGFVENAGHTAGVLTVKNGSTTITLNLKGNYASGTFSKGTDGQSGTLVTYAPAGGGNAFQPARVPPIGTKDPVFSSPSPTLVIGGQRATAPGASGTNLGISLATMFGGHLRTALGAPAARLETFGRDPFGHMAVGFGDLTGHGRSSLGLHTIAGYHSDGSS